MLSRSQRLNHHTFSDLFASGRRVHSSYFTLIVNDSDITQGAIVVGKKVSKKAVVRNSIRRRLYPILGTYLRSLTTPRSIIVLVKPVITTIPYTEQRQVFFDVLAQLDKVR